jgi:hypothetical protein
VTPSQQFLQKEMQRRQAGAQSPPAQAAITQVLPPVAGEVGLNALLRKAADQKYVAQLQNAIKGSPGKLVGAGALLSILAGAAELADQGDPLAKNIAEGVGITGGGMAGAAAGAAIGGALGGPLAPITALIGAGIGGTFGSGAGKGAMGGLYNLVANEDENDKKLRRQMRAQRMQTQMDVEREKAMSPVIADQMRIKLADDIQRMERELAVKNDYNYANMLNTASLNSQQNHANQLALLTQYMLG